MEINDDNNERRVHARDLVSHSRTEEVDVDERRGAGDIEENSELRELRREIRTLVRYRKAAAKFDFVPRINSIRSRTRREE